MLKNQYSYINNKTYLIFGITQIGLLKVYLELPRLVHIVGSGNLVLMSVNGLCPYSFFVLEHWACPNLPSILVPNALHNLHILFYILIQIYILLFKHYV